MKMTTHSKDLTLETPHGKFTLRVGYLAFQNDSILLQQDTKNGYWFVTGGRVEFGSSTEETVFREIAEELSLDIQESELAGLLENFFTLNGYDYHEVCTYYRVQLPDNFTPPTHEANGDPITLAWHKIEDLKNLDIRPSFLKEELGVLKSGFTHRVHRGK